MSNEPTNSSLDLDLLAWFEVNKKAVYGGLALIFVVAAAVIVWRHQQDTARRRAGEALALAVLNAGPGAQSVGVDRLNDVASEHPGTPTARQARLLAAQELFTGGRYAEARAGFDELTAGADEIASIALFGVAASLDAQNETEAALKGYQAVVDLPAAAFLAPEARMAKARLLERSERWRAALDEYDALTADPTSLAAQQAFMRRAEILRAHPELATPAAPASVTNMVNVVAPATP